MRQVALHREINSALNNLFIKSCMCMPVCWTVLLLCLVDLQAVHFTLLRNLMWLLVLLINTAVLFCTLFFFAYASWLFLWFRAQKWV